MDDAARRLNDPEAPPVEPAPAVDPREVVKAQIRQVESSGDDNAVPIDPNTGKLLSSAYGRYQFTEGTWKRYYVRRFGRRSEEHTSELQSLMRTSYAVFCLKKKKNTTRTIKPPDTTSRYTDIKQNTNA